MQVNQIHFGKSKYHQNTEMTQWCTDNIGVGGWVNGDGTAYTIYADEYTWTVHSMFGTTTFNFANAADLTLFALKWS